MQMNLTVSNPATVWAVAAEGVSILLGIGTLVAFLFKRPAPRHKWKIVAVTCLITLVVGSALLYSLYRSAQASTWTIRVARLCPHM
jgi:drug/metabolite transporter (DMT)-like permease